MNAKARWRLAYRMARTCQGPLTNKSVPFGLWRQTMRARDSLHDSIWNGRWHKNRILNKYREKWHRRNIEQLPDHPMCRCITIPITRNLP